MRKFKFTGSMGRATVVEADEVLFTAHHVVFVRGEEQFIVFAQNANSVFNLEEQE